MPLGAARIALLAKTQVTVVAEVYRPQVGVSAFGNAQIDTAQSQFGGSSALFDGTGDYLDTNDVLIPATGDFTLEAWVRLDTTGANRSIIEQYNGTASGRLGFSRQGSLNVFQLFIGDYSGSSDIILRSTTNPSINTWYHVAVVRSGNDFELFVDGTSEDTQTASGVTIYTGDDTRIGKLGSGDYFDGYIDELRISDSARYTSGFTPSTSQFENDANTLLLLHMDGDDATTSFIDDNGTWDDAIEEGGYYFTGTTDYSSFTSDPSEFTVSFWAKMGASQSGDMYVMQMINEKSGGASNAMLIRFETTGDLEIYYQSGYRYNFNVADMHITTGDNAWHHFVFSVDTVNETNKLYIDGADSGQTVTNTTADPDMTQVLKLGIGVAASAGSPIGVGSGVAQVAMWDTYYDLSTNIDKFYDTGPADLGTDGTNTGLAAPFLYHYGNTNLFDTNAGRTTGETLSYPTLTSEGSPIDSFINT